MAGRLPRRRSRRAESAPCRVARKPSHERSPMADRIDLMHPDVRANPYPLYARLRRESVCQVDPGGVWALARHDDILFALKRPDLFSSAAFQVLLKPPWLGHNPLGVSILAMDAPGHTKLRALINRGF